MSDYDTSEPDWDTVEQKLSQINRLFKEVEGEIACGFEDFHADNNDLTTLAMDANNIPRDVDELIKGVTNSSSYLRNGTMSYIPSN